MDSHNATCPNCGEPAPRADHACDWGEPGPWPVPAPEVAPDPEACGYCGVAHGYGLPPLDGYRS